MAFKFVLSEPLPTLSLINSLIRSFFNPKFFASKPINWAADNPKI